MPSISGVSWFGVLVTESLPPSSTSQAQPLPKRVAAALAKGLRMLWEGLPQQIEALRSEGANPLGAFRVFADRLLNFALQHPRLCRFVLSGGTAGSVDVGAGQVVESLLAFAESSAGADRAGSST